MQNEMFYQPSFWIMVITLLAYYTGVQKNLSVPEMELNPPKTMTAESLSSINLG